MSNKNNNPTSRDRGGRNWMYVQQLSHLPAQFPPLNHQLDTFLDENLPRGTKWAWKLHDQDTFTADHVAVIEGKRKIGERREDHIHISIKLPNTKTASAMAKLFNDKPQYFQKFTGDNAVQNMFAYLIHRTEGSKKDGKFEYSPKDVYANFDYQTYVDGVTTGIKTAQIEKDTIQQEILTGKLRFIDIISHDDLAGFYLKNKQFVQNAIDIRYKREMNAPMESRRKVNVIYVEGAAGSGKSTFAQAFASKNFGDFCLSSSKNDIVQDYLGQKCMIFDDARTDQMEFDEWMRVLDPYNGRSTVSSRYYNKYLSVECIILTSVTPFEQFPLFCKRGGFTEPIAQWFRRFSSILKVEKEEENGSANAFITEFKPVSDFPRFVYFNKDKELEDCPLLGGNNTPALINKKGYTYIYPDKSGLPDDTKVYDMHWKIEPTGRAIPPFHLYDSINEASLPDDMFRF